MGKTLIHYTSIFIESQWGSPSESFIQKYWLVSNLPIFQNYRFFEKGPKNQKILKNSKFSFAFLVAIMIGLFYSMFVFIPSVVVDIQKDASEFYCRKISSGHHCTHILTLNPCISLDMYPRCWCIFLPGKINVNKDGSIHVTSMQ